jgi:thiamine-monophosphate kinase
VKIAELGEFGLINLIGEMVGRAGKAPAELIFGIGDDAAAWRCSGGVHLGTVDSLVEGVHFTLDTISWEELGWKSLAVNLSDIAAMGGVARYALISLALPSETLVSDATAFYRGLLSLARKTGVALVGGDTCRSPLVNITITVIGEAPCGKVLRRSGARIGDLVAVTGYLGSAAAGLVMLGEKLKLEKGLAVYLGESFRKPSPRLAEGRLLVNFGVQTGMDISDGLVIDLGHIAEMSRVSARIEAERVPIEPRVEASFGARALELALSGGEDYELLFTADRETIGRLQKALSVPVTVVGEIVAGETGKVGVVASDGHEIKLSKPGWEHFGS